MSRRRPLASEHLKFAAARTVGFDGKVRESGWGAATTREIGLMVREMIRRGQQVIADGANRPAGPADSGRPE